MIRNVHWAAIPSFHGISSPFDKKNIERPLMITIDVDTINRLGDDQKEALALLYEFASWPNPIVNIILIKPDGYPVIEFGKENKDNKDINILPVTVRYPDGLCFSGIPFPEQYPDLASDLVLQLHQDPRFQPEALQDLLYARAHCSQARDIFVTGSKWLLGNLNFDFVKDANPFLPSDAVKLLGLLMRARDDFRYRGDIFLNRGLFYWSLARYKTPAMWRYFDVCVHSSSLRGDDILFLGQSILIRCARAFQSRDAIGNLFYVAQNNDTRDETMYHFDYLTLLLSGAIDAQARVAHRAYQIPSKIRERNVSFRDAGFVQELIGADGTLGAYIKSDDFKEITSILSRIRNTIHGASLTTTAFMGGPGPGRSFIEIPESDSDTIWEVCEKYGSTDSWGVIKLTNKTVRLEPYTFSSSLLEHGLEIINTIASLTKIEKLFPSGSPIPVLTDKPPHHDPLFNDEAEKRILLLG